jgi:hypothetical protein
MQKLPEITLISLLGPLALSEPLKGSEKWLKEGDGALSRAPGGKEVWRGWAWEANQIGQGQGEGGSGTKREGCSRVV